jgi:hypothetical protein
MAKQNGFGNSLGDLLVAAMGGDSKKVKQVAEAKPATKPTAPALSNHKQSSPASAASKAQPIENCSRPTSARTISNPTKLIYNAGKRSSDEVKADFLAPHNSFNKRKGILEGVTYHLHRLGELRNPDTETRQRLVDFQDLKREFELNLKEMKSEVIGQQKVTSPARSISTNTITSHDRSTVSEKKYHSLFNHRDQFDTASTNASSCDVIIGLDFGTACTKVIVRTPDHFGNACFVVPFGQHGHKTNDHLLPTHLSIANNHYYLPIKGSSGQYSNLKMHLIESLTSIDEGDAIDNAIAYLALLFRYVRTWFIRENHESYGEFRLIWQVNIGIPSASAECDDLCQLYQKAVYTAWQFSQQNGDITYPELLKLRELLHTEQQLETQELITVFPEVAAEVAGYTQSDMRQEGLHLLVDIGAGTLDVCGFNVHRHNGENLLPLFSTSVERQGVCMLHEIRSNSVENCLKNLHSSLMPDPATPLNCDKTYYVPDKKSCEKAVDDAEMLFLHSCSNQVHGVVHQLRTSMDPRSSRWNSYLPVFLCGGGSTMPQYRELISVLSRWLRNNIGECQARLLEIPRPENLRGDIKTDEYHRFAVAWGLSYRSFDIDQVITNVKPVQPRTINGTERPWYERANEYCMADVG